MIERTLLLRWMSCPSRSHQNKLFNWKNETIRKSASCLKIPMQTNTAKSSSIRNSIFTFAIVKWTANISDINLYSTHRWLWYIKALGNVSRQFIYFLFCFVFFFNIYSNTSMRRINDRSEWYTRIFEFHLRATAKCYKMTQKYNDEPLQSAENAR